MPNLTTVKAKICGLRTPDAVKAAVSADASHIGFVFYEKSPRNVTPEQAAKLSTEIPKSVVITGVFVDPSDDLLKSTLKHAPLNLIQLHGEETPERVAEIKKNFNLPVMKAIAVDCPEHIAQAKEYENTADMLLFDAKAPDTLEDGLPGGNGLSFDWHLINGTEWRIPWMLSGGLDVDNVCEAISTSHAKMVDVSSGVESRPGIKSIAKITAFMNEVKNI